MLPMLDSMLRKLPPGVRLARWEPAATPIRPSESETIEDSKKFIATTLDQLSAHLSGKGFIDGGWGLSGLIDRLAACGCHVVLDDPGRALQ